MTKTKLQKTYPSRVLEEALRAAGIRYTVCWETPGPKNTGVAWMHAIHFGAGICIIQTFYEGGWEAYVPASDSNRVDETIAAVFNRLLSNRPNA